MVAAPAFALVWLWALIAPLRYWIEVEPPAFNERGCADADWRVRLVDGAVVVERAAERAPSSDEPRLRLGWLPAGRRHILAQRDGYLVGHDGGEFAGGLYWVSRGGRKLARLSDENVYGIFALGDGRALVLEGQVDGSALWLARTPGGGWVDDGRTPLGGSPRAFTVNNDSLYLLDQGALTKLTLSTRKVETLRRIPFVPLSPTSLVVDRNGTVWAGSDGFVVSFLPADGYHPHWFTPRACASAVRH